MAVAHGQVDVVVVGGGPAGATAALTLARSGLSVLLVERSTRWPIRTGEGLPPMARPLLESLGLWERFRAAGHLPSSGNRSAWGSSELFETDFIFNPYGHGWHLDRSVFDAMIVAAAEQAGVLRLSATRVAWEPTAAGGALRIHQDGRELTATARAVLDCSGQAAAIVHRLGARRIHRDKLVAVVALHRPGRGGDVDSTTLVEAAPDGWWYTALLPGDRRVFVYLTDGDLLDVRAARDVTEWLARLKRTDHLQQIHERFEYKVLVPPTIVPAGSSKLCPAAGDGWIAAGDSAISFDPLSSQGIVTAMSLGQQAALSMLNAWKGDVDAITSYLSTIDRLERDYMARRHRYYALERRWAESPFWSRRSSAV
ncbi:flavin-dependent dehydrogenase [Skermanella aerolata]|uniref:NAD(P)/FAD-dependent oxidoreductase n=1 Tax=Skermanella aerolata TaxID=393310 RepID=UPI003D23A060